jgi:photosystem II stability/assembly factor-like uncharacterized protein
MSKLLRLMLVLTLITNHLYISPPKDVRAGSSDWIPTGPNGGQVVSALAYNPSNPNIVYLGTYSGGFYVSFDGGINWQAPDVDLPVVTGSLSLVVDPVDPDNVYVATYDGVYKSEDAGFTWFLSSLGLSERLIYIEINPVENNVLYAGTHSGIYKSVDYGATWYYLAFVGEHTNKIYVDSHEPNRIFAFTHYPTILWQSTDGGSSWTEVSTPDYGISAVDFDRNNPGTIYVGGISWNSQSLYVYKSINYGASWDSIGLYGIRKELIHVDPSNSNVIYIAGEDGLFRTINGGNEWEELSVGEPYDVGFVRTIAINPTNNNNYLLGGTFYDGQILSGGVMRTTDYGDHFSLEISGITSHTIMDLVFDPKNENTIYVGTIYGIHKSVDGGLNWRPINSGLPIGASTWDDTIISQIVIDPYDSNVLYAAISGDGFFKTTDAGDSWTEINTGIILPSNPTSLVINPQKPIHPVCRNWGRRI